MKTKVIFRTYKNGDIIALFPEIPVSFTQWWLCSSYMHIGQHGAASYSKVLKQTKPANPSQYAALKQELESAPYNYKLIVHKRRSKKMRHTLEQSLPTI